ncbi:hypothetical protein A3K73_02820 [Candidatus Pacearchaeota archaeon RBG_13_36_9]|nr:MAG: hypothetical protein A3K73_02820 [Candidatus Pacearchaeota archaeon RBG_13_36_9]
MKRVLCICALGRNRSRYLAKYLAKKGYETRHGGVNCSRCKKCRQCRLLLQGDVDWAEVIVIVRKILVKNFKEKYKWKGKKIIVLDVTDSRKVAARKDPRWLRITNRLFQEYYVHAHLRRAIKPYLPL